MQFSSKYLSQNITQLCKAKGISHIVLSPGSRNAPLTIGFTSDDFFTNYSIVDERCAAFFALGIAQQTKNPVALVCSSGSALLNYYPAISEAFYSDIPLVILSADRPSDLVEIGDGQTILQENVFANHILYSANCKEGEDFQLFNETEINIALNTALELRGPVHINLPFSEPLYERVSDVSVRPQHVPARVNNPTTIDASEIAQYSKRWNSASRKMILVGVLEPNAIEVKLINKLAEDPSVIVLTETTSNLHHENFFPSIDQLIAPLDKDDLKQLQPEILLTFGGMIVSKKVKAFLRKFSPETHWHVDLKKAYDTFFALEKHFKYAVNNFLGHLLSGGINVESNYYSYWSRVKSIRLKKHEMYMNEIPFSDFMVFHRIVEMLPKHELNLQLGNSTTIRYAQLFDLPSNVSVNCNRGTSGIDGSTSTAIGAAVVKEKQTVFITGDLSFLYDSNGLWNNYIPKHFRIIIINNSGGGIFRILPKAKQTEHFETFFETKHELTAVHLAAMYGFEYISVANDITLKESLSNFYNVSEKPKILEVFTPSEINDKILLAYFDYIS